MEHVKTFLAVALGVIVGGIASYYVQIDLAKVQVEETMKSFQQLLINPNGEQ